MRRARLVDKNGYQTTGYRKRATALLLTVALLFCLVTLPVTAAEPTRPSGAERTATERLRRGFTSCEEAIDLLDCGLSPAEVGRMYAGLLQDDPTLFHVAPRLSYALQGNTVATVYPTYTLQGEALAEAQALYRDTIADLLASIDAVFDGSGAPRGEAEIVLLVHDLLAARYDYDTRVLAGGEGYADAYRFFREGVGVCQAYAMAAIALLRGAGLSADLVTSAAMDHAWVHVRVGDAWYHMDVTRDDPVTVRPDGAAVSAGMVTHTRLLRSDAGMAALGYHAYTCAAGHTCTDSRYESADAMALLCTFTAPLVAVSLGENRPLVWVGTGADGAPRAMRLSADGIRVQAVGDIDGDERVTPADLLCLPEGAWRGWLRDVLTGETLRLTLGDIPEGRTLKTPAGAEPLYS